MQPTPTDASRTLRDLLRIEGRLPFERATEILTQLTNALVPLHAAGRAHGALTPQSVHLEADGTVRLGPPTGDRLAMGLLPPSYLAPEIIDGEPMSPASDVYTLGLLGWEMLVGQAPWAGESVAEVVTHQREQDLPRLTTLRPGVPRPLLLAIEGALHKSPGDRWRSAVEMLTELRRVGGMAHTRASDTATAAATGAAAGAAAAAAVAATEPVVVAPTPVTPRRAPAAPLVPAEPIRRSSGGGRKFAMTALILAILIAGGAALAAMQHRSKKQVATQPWLDSITTSTAAGVVITDDTTSSAARMRMNQVRDSLARLQALGAAPPPMYSPAPTPSYGTPMPAPTVDTAAAAALARNDALARAAAAAEAERARAEARAIRDSIARERAAVGDSARPLRSTVPTTAPATPAAPSKPDSAPKKPKPDSVPAKTPPDTIPMTR